MSIQRNTRQREAILQAIEEADRPLSPGEIHELGKRYYDRLGLRTVYRNIRELVEQGKLVGIDYPGQPMRYEPVSEQGHHPHFICRHCGRIYDLDEAADEVPYTAPPGFTIDGQETIFYGTCPSCNPAKTLASASAKVQRGS